jgi:cell division protein FtsL
MISKNIKFMNRKNSLKVGHWLFAAWVSVIGSSLSVVYLSNACRVLTSEIANLERQSNILQETRGKYLIEKGTHTSLNNIESLAINNLNMKAPKRDEFIAIFP